MSSEYINKMQKTAALINKVLLVVNSIIFVVISTLLMIFINQCIEAYHGNFQALANQITFNSITLPVDTKLMMAEKMVPAFIVIYIFIFITALCVFRIINMVRKILKCVAEKRPFDGTVSNTLTKLGKTILGMGLLFPFVEFCIERAISIAYEPLFTEISTQLDGFNILFQGVSIDFTVLFLGLFVMLLGYIFRYGEELQQLSDETL